MFLARRRFAANLVAVDSVDPDEEGGTHTRAPVRMTLRYALERWVAFRFECIRLRAAHEERRASTRLHIVEGLLIAQRHADVVVELVRGSATPAEAKEALRDPLRFAETLSAEQADAVLALRLARLTTLETDKLTEESVILTSKLKELRDVLASDQTVYDVMIDESPLALRHTLKTGAVRVFDVHLCDATLLKICLFFRLRIETERHFLSLSLSLKRERRRRTRAHTYIYIYISKKKNNKTKT